jgi:bacitracin transport system permease protein
MLSLIHIELIKLKRAKIVWVIGVFLCLIPIFYGILLRNSQTSYGIPSLLKTFMWNNATTLGSLIGPLLFGLLATYIFGREFVENTVKHIRTSPVALEKVILSKIVVLFLLCIVLLVVMFSVSLVTGLYAGFTGFYWEMLETALVCHLVTVLLIFATLPITAFIAMIGKGYLVSTGFVSAVTILDFTIQAMQTRRLGAAFPWSIAGTYASDVYKGTIPMVTRLEAVSVIIVVFTFLIGIVLSMAYIRYANLDD